MALPEPDKDDPGWLAWWWASFWYGVAASDDPLILLIQDGSRIIHEGPATKQ